MKKKYKSIINIVDAIQYTGDNVEEIEDFIKDTIFANENFQCFPGNYVVKSTNNVIYVLHESTFINMFIEI